MFVKLQRPPPEIKILRPISALCSSTTARRPRLPASIAHISPAAPPPITATSIGFMVVSCCDNGEIAMSRKILIVTGDGGDSYEALYAYHRFLEARWQPVVA